MKSFRKLAILLPILLLGDLSPTTVAAQTTQIDFNINGVRLGSTYSQALMKLGKPRRTRIQRYSKERSCLGDPMILRILDYRGLRVWVLGVGRDKPVVLGIIVSGPQYSFRGVRIGFSESSVVERLGPLHPAETKGTKNISIMTHVVMT